MKSILVALVLLFGISTAASAGKGFDVTFSVSLDGLEKLGRHAIKDGIKTTLSKGIRVSDVWYQDWYKNDLKVGLEVPLDTEVTVYTERCENWFSCPSNYAFDSGPDYSVRAILFPAKPDDRRRGGNVYWNDLGFGRFCITRFQGSSTMSDCGVEWFAARDGDTPAGWRFAGYDMSEWAGGPKYKPGFACAAIAPFVCDLKVGTRGDRFTVSVHFKIACPKDDKRIDDPIPRRAWAPYC